MKVAILIVGHIRTWEECKLNFLESFYHLKPDVFVSTYDLQYNYHPAGRQHWMGGSSDDYLSEEHIKNIFKDINVINFDIENIEDVTDYYNYNKNKLHENFKNECHTVLQYRKIMRAIEVMTRYETETDTEYDVVIKIRPDIFHKKFFTNIENNTIVVSTKNVFPNDVFIGANRNDFISLFKFIDSEFYNQIYDNSHLKAPHNLLLAACNHYNFDIHKIDIMDYVLRKTGKNYYEDLN